MNAWEKSQRKSNLLWTYRERLILAICSYLTFDRENKPQVFNQLSLLNTTMLERLHDVLGKIVSTKDSQS